MSFLLAAFLCFFICGYFILDFAVLFFFGPREFMESFQTDRSQRQVAVACVGSGILGIALCVAEAISRALA